ncbi:MAG: translocation/assembly module TamB domain-containing protein [Terriglobales bacterium]
MSLAVTPPPPPPPHRRRHVWRWVGICVACAIAFLIVATWLVTSSVRFQNYVIGKAEKSASTALGTPVYIARFRVHIHSLLPSVDVYGIRVAGKAVARVATPPLLKLAHVHVAIHIASLLHRSWQLESIELDHPVVHVVVDAQGHTNLPSGARAAAGPDIFALGIRHASIKEGEVYVNDREQSLSANLSGVALVVGWQSSSESYSGTLSYERGTVQLAGMRPVATAVALRFTVSRSGVDIPALTLTAPGAKLSAQARLSSYSSPQLTANYQLQLVPKQLGLRALPVGEVRVVGTVTYAVQGVRASGHFSSALLSVQAGSVRAPIHNLRGAYRFSGGKLEVSQLAANVVGGRLNGRLGLSFAGTRPVITAQLHLHGAQMGQLARLSSVQTTFAALGISGRLNAEIAAHGGTELETLIAAAKLTVSARVGQVPVQGAAQVDFGGGQLRIGQSRLSTPHAQIEIAGRLVTQARRAVPTELHISASSSDLAALETLAGRLAAAVGKPLPALGLGGRARFRGEVSGTLAAPAISGQFHAASLAFRHTRWNALEAAIAACPTRVQIEHLRLSSGRAQIQLTAALGLAHWGVTPSSPVQAILSISSLPLAMITALVPAPLPLTGTLSAHAQIRGTFGAPSGQGNARLEPVRLKLGGVDAGLEAVQLEAQGTATAVDVQLAAQLAAGKLQASGTLHPANGAYSAQLSGSALVLGKIPVLVAQRMGVTGTLAVSGHGQGTLAHPVFEVAVSSANLAASGQQVHDLHAQIQIAGGHLQATLAGTALKTPVRAQAALELSGDLPISAVIDAPAIPLAPLVAAFAPAQAGQIEGQTALHITLQGPLRRPAQLAASIHASGFDLHYDKILELKAAQPIQASLAHGIVQLQPARFIGTQTDLEVAGTLPIPDLGATAASAMHFSVTGKVNLKIAELFARGMNSGGEVTLNLTASGPLAKPAVNGDIELSQVSVSNPLWPIAVQNGQGTFRLHGGRLDLTSFTAALGGGSLKVTGGLAITPKPRFNFSVAARQIQVRYPPGLRETVAAEVNLAGTPAAALVSGRVQVENVSPVPGFDFATLTNQIAEYTVNVARPGSFLDDLRLEIAVTTPNQIAITSRDFSLHANANVNLRGTAQEPVVLGRVDLSSGDLIFQGNRYIIQSGTLDFVNPVRTIPNVNVTADTTIQQYAIHLRFEGPVDNLRTAYTSDPALPPADIINLLAFGETTEAGAANPLPGNLGAETLVAGAVTGQITDRVEKIAGISHLSVDPVLGGGQQNAGARITIQQRVTANLYVTISTDVAATERNVIEVQYKLSPRVSVNGVRKQNGGFGANLQFKKIWH